MPINVFDAAFEYEIRFQFDGGNQVVRNRLVIKNNESGATAYYQTIDSYRLSVMLPANTLQNGTTYNIYAQVFDIQGTTTTSATILFKCLTTPLWKFTNVEVGDVIRTSNYDFTLFGKGLQYIDVNDSKACYVKGGRGNSLYTADYDGGNEKLLYTLEPEAGKTIYFQEVVLNENYAAFISEPAGGYTYVSDTRNPENVTRTGSASYCYYGVIDLRTGEASVLKGGFHGRLKAFGDTFLWHGYPEGSWNNELPSEIITFKDGKFNAMETKTGQEVLTAAADNDGRIITADSGESYGDSILIRIYENGSCIKEITEDIGQPFGLGNIRANNGVIALSYTTSSGGKIKGNVKLISY